MRKQWLAAGLAVLIGSTASAQAQTVPTGTAQPSQTTPQLPGVSSTPAGIILATPVQPPSREYKPSSNGVVRSQYEVSGALEAASRPDELATIEGEMTELPKWGPTPPEDVGLLMGHGRFGDILNHNGVRVYGWLDQGYTYASTGPGFLTVETRENRFGNEYLLNEMAIVVEKPLNEKELSFGYNATFWAGADPALLQPRGGFDTTNPRFGADFRQLYVSAHLPILSDGGVDIKAGRQGTIIGYESALAPYRPFYSNDYQWFYSEDGAWTGVLANWHVTNRLDILNGITLGANTFFTLRGDGPCYIGQINYWLQDEKRTLLTVSGQAGNQAIFAAPGFTGKFVSVLELRVQHEWSKRLTQIVQCNMGWETGAEGVGTTQWYGLYSILVYHLSPHIDTNSRVEWFEDSDGSRTGVATSYEEITLGIDYHPEPWFSLRPEIRADFAGTSVFGRGQDAAQLTLAVDALLKY
jgi:hypothetical protein